MRELLLQCNLGLGEVGEIHHHQQVLHRVVEQPLKLRHVNLRA